jgi:SAM-dependent methyltransferase
MEDQKAQDYFDNFTPGYDPERFNFAIPFINEHSNGKSTLIDIGCGDGATLHLIKQKTPIRFLEGLDTSRNYLRKAQQLLECEFIFGSILDKDLVRRYSNKYDFCILGAVLHHLTGRNRKESYLAAQDCLVNSVTLLKKNGYLILFEPTHSPAFLMTLVFYLKKIFGSFSNHRIELLSKWANFGQPIVSFYTLSQMDRLIKHIEHAKIIEKKIVDETRLGLIIKRVRLGVILQKS